MQFIAKLRIPCSKLRSYLESIVLARLKIRASRTNWETVCIFVGQKEGLGWVVLKDTLAPTHFEKWGHYSPYSPPAGAPPLCSPCGRPWLWSAKVCWTEFPVAQTTIPQRRCYYNKCLCRVIRSCRKQRRIIMIYIHPYLRLGTTSGVFGRQHKAFIKTQAQALKPNA